jgi:CRISPR-associated protein Csd1
MILHALNAYYDRLIDDHKSGVPQMGFCSQGVHFCLVLDDTGRCVGDPIDLRDGNTPMMLVVPQAVKRTSGIAANFLWDNTGYVLGADDKGKPERAALTFDAFKSLQHHIGSGVKDKGMKAVLAFLDTWNQDGASNLPLWQEMAGKNVVFKLDGDNQFIHDRPAVKSAWLDHFKASESEIKGRCLISGRSEVPISRLHAPIKGVLGAQSSGAALVSFNLQAFTSYGKDQNFNAPVGEDAAFAYTTSLNHLLSRGSRQKVQIADTTIIFWTKKASPVESFMAGLFDPKVLEDAPDVLVEDLRHFLEAVTKGKHPKTIKDLNNPFYILGLSPNASRLSVRFWHASTVGEITDRVGQHFRDLSIVKNYDSDPDNPALWQLLRETAVRGDSRNISPLLGGQLTQAILTGQQYPRTLLTGVLLRIRADKKINYFRAAMLKAYLTRNFKMEVKREMDTESKSIGYQLGRLFSILEKAQEEAISGASATIKDRFFGAASATPMRVFPILLKGVQNNISKLRKTAETRGRSIYFDKLITEIASNLSSFPATLSLEEQGMFALGYYHQRRDFFTKKTEHDIEET